MQTKEFLSQLAGVKEYSDAKQIIKPREDETCYFLSGVSDPTKRNMDNDIIEKNYFAFDFDIRNWFKTNESYDIPDDEIKETALDIGKYLLQNPYFWFEDWRFIVFSGGGFHLYYVWDKLKVPDDITPKQYSAWVLYLQEKFNRYMQIPYARPDKACRNIARIFRLPWTTNKKYWNKSEILISTEAHSKLVSQLPKLWNQQIALDDELAELKAKKYHLETSYKLQKELITQWDKDFLEQIILVPAEKILIESWKIPIKDFVREKNFVDPRDNSYYGFWKAQDGNYIVTGWSTTISPYSNWLEWLNPFSLVKWLYSLEDKEVYNWFRSYFSNLK